MTDLKSLLMTLVACYLMGWLLTQFGLPAPYLIGSLLGGWLLAKSLPKALPTPGIPRGFHKMVVLGLSTLIGATFTPNVLAQFGLWIGTVSAMLVTTLVATWGGYYFLRYRRHYDSSLALLCALPGGQAEIIAISRDLVEKDYVVAFCHLVRVATVVCLIPLLLALSEGSEGVVASYAAADQLPSITHLPLKQLAWFLAIGGLGYATAVIIHLPIPHLLGPLLLSSFFHIIDWANIPRISEFVILAQLTIGGAVGARLGQIKMGVLASYLFDALCLSSILVSVYIAVALCLAWLGGFSSMEMVLAFVPGGIYEVTVLALVFGFDVALVAFHHTVRVLIIFLGLPFLTERLKRLKNIRTPD